LVVKVDLSKAPSAAQMQPEPNQTDIVVMQDESESKNGINDAKRKIKDILIQFKIRDFVAITDPVDRQKILIIGRGEAERLDSFHCRHYGMEFIDEIQLGIHQKLHLPF
jgi:hypothetical protein